MTSRMVLALVLLAGTCYAEVNRIVGGELTTIEVYPSIVQSESLNVFTSTWSQSCAANILNSRYVLSAAHCFEGTFYHARRRRIRAGTTFRNTGGSVVPIDRAYNHPSYIPRLNGFDGDISVIRLAQPLEFSPVIQPGAIIQQDAVIPDNVPVIHAGWGTTSEGGPISPHLRDVTIYTVNRDICRERYLLLSDTDNITKNMICAGILDVGGRDACQGDSGGPMYYGQVLVGVVSSGYGCANGTFPGLPLPFKASLLNYLSSFNFVLYSSILFVFLTILLSFLILLFNKLISPSCACDT